MRLPPSARRSYTRFCCRVGQEQPQKNPIPVLGGGVRNGARELLTPTQPPPLWGRSRSTSLPGMGRGRLGWLNRYEARDSAVRLPAVRSHQSSNPNPAISHPLRPRRAEQSHGGCVGCCGRYARPPEPTPHRPDRSGQRHPGNQTRRQCPRPAVGQSSARRR